MPIDPEKRQGKGRFDAPSTDSSLDETFVDNTLKQASTRTTLLDMLFMVIVGFWEMLRGLLTASGSSPSKKDEEVSS